MTVCHDAKHQMTICQLNCFCLWAKLENLLVSDWNDTKSSLQSHDFWYLYNGTL